MVTFHRSVRTHRVPTITAVIPCYNYGRFLSQAVDSVLSQTGVDPRVIIVDDCSTDDSLDVARELASGDSRITVIHHEKNAGHIATYNDGLRRVETEFAVLLSADDYLADGALGRATALMTEHPTVGLVYGLPKEFVDGEPRLHGDGGKSASWTVWKGRQWAWLAAFRGRCFILSPEVVMRTEALHQVGDYNSELPHSGDLEYWIRTAARWDIGRINGPAQAYYRTHGGNMHLTTFAGMDRDLLERLEAFKVLATEPVASLLDEKGTLLSMARRGIAREARILAVRNADSGGPAGYSRTLLDFAQQISPGSIFNLRSWHAQRRCAAVESGKPATTTHRAAEELRRQIDRVRWVLWKKIGVS